MAMETMMTMTQWLGLEHKGRQGLGLKTCLEPYVNVLCMCVFFYSFFYTNLFYNLDYSTYYRNDDNDTTAEIGT